MAARASEKPDRLQKCEQSIITPDPPSSSLFTSAQYPPGLYPHINAFDSGAGHRYRLPLRSSLELTLATKQHHARLIFFRRPAPLSPLRPHVPCICQTILRRSSLHRRNIWGPRRQRRNSLCGQICEFFALETVDARSRPADPEPRP